MQAGQAGHAAPSTSSSDSFGTGIFEPTPERKPAAPRPAEIAPRPEVRRPPEEAPRAPARSEPDESGGFGAGI
jgi:hypothetical protein